MSRKKRIKTHVVPIEEVIPNPKNPRRISEEKMQQLCNSMRDTPELINYRFLVVDRKTGFILGGNQRWAAARKLGWETIPIVYADEMTEEERREFIIRDNVESGEWDEKMLDENFRNFPLIDWGLIEAEHTPPAERREEDKSGLKEAKKVYDNAKVKQIVVFYDLDTHGQVVEKLEEVRENNHLKDNGEVLMFLIENYAK